ncbi:hypothetical protein D3OALGB2SA_5075 [Olavius algarvensis associated proteobacterium Delta 3]|nr:hypothetical protein D3OALGB2SA_5075 [Olavius algarvensis associated proteobacterium Delta 3]
MNLPNPVIVVPGITATYLQDQYPLPPENIWTVLKKNYERLTLHPDNLNYEVNEPSRVVPDQLFEVAYRALIEELRFNLSPNPDSPVPVFPFGYDWRQPLEETERELAGFVDEVMERTKLLRHYHKAGFSKNPRVSLIGHSMGGLVITGYLARYGQEAAADKVVTLATPYRGSFEAVIQVVTGTANLGTGEPASRDREAARLTPALYHLLPAFKNGLVPPQLPVDALFDPTQWQPSIVATLAQYIRRKGLPGDPPKQRAKALFNDLLGQAKTHRARIRRFRPAAAGMDLHDWLVVIGADATTRVRLEVKKVAGKPQFRLHSLDRENQWDSADPAERRMTGDGTVPFEGALPPFLPEDHLVCVTPDDYGYWELQDKTLTKLAGFHGILPNMNMLHRMIARFLAETPDTYGNTWGRRVPGVATWSPPLKLREK